MLWASYSVDNILFFLTGQRDHTPDFTEWLKFTYPVQNQQHQPQPQPQSQLGPAQPLTTLASIPRIDRPMQHYPISVPKTCQIRSEAFCKIEKMISAFCFLLCCLRSSNGCWIFHNLPPIITDQSNLHALPPSTHQFLFQPIGKFATDVHYMHIQIPIYFTPVFENLAHVQKTMMSL